MSRFQDQASLDPAERTLFKLSEVARLFGISVQTLHYWVKSGRIQSLQRTSPGGSYLVPRAELVRLLADADREVPGLWEKRRPRILLIDDNKEIRKLALAAARSSKMPLSLRAASSVEDGLLSAAQFRPEVILLDTSFPTGKLRGDQGLAFIRGTKILRKVRVVALVNNPRTGAGMLRGGADAFLLKPFGLSEFRAAIEPERKRGKTEPSATKISEQAPSP